MTELTEAPGTLELASSSSSRRRASRATEISRAIKALKKVGLEVAAVRVEPDGAVTIIPGSPTDVALSPQPNPWDAS